MSHPNLPPGYEFKKVLGRSMLSEVFLVQHESGARYALKILRASAARDPRVEERFRREVQLLEDWHHPNLIQGYGSIEVDGRQGLLLEYITGSTLKDAVGGKPMGWEQVARYGVQISRALDKLHRGGALHRDVKPHNVLLDDTRGAILADLGLVRRTTDPALTRQGAALGSPAYMSPEQTKDPSGVGPAADVYSLGATLHHALTGAPPFLGKGVGEVIHRVLHVEPEPLPTSLPEPLKKVLATAMAKDPERRYQRARDLGGDLGRVLLGLPPNLMTAFRRKRRKRIAMAIGIAPLLLLGGEMLLDATGWLDSKPKDSSAEAMLPVQKLENPGASGPPSSASTFDVVSQRRLFQSWAASYQDRHRAAFQEGAYRMAWQALGHFAQATFPSNAEAKFFEQLRRDEIQRGRQRLETLAREIFVDVAEVLHAQSEIGSGQIQAGSFHSNLWAQEAEKRLLDRVPRARQLPMYPGDEDPLDLLSSYQLTLERQNRQAWTARARELVPVLRPQIDRLLRAGNMQDAWRLWKGMDTRLLAFSLEARRESWRMQQLFDAQRSLDKFLEGKLGTEISLPLQGGELRGRVGMHLQSDNRVLWEIQNPQGEPHPVNLLELDPLRIDEVLNTSQLALLWLEGQLLWCNQHSEQAVQRMKELALQEWPPEADPYFWAKEWERLIALERSDMNSPEDASQTALNHGLSGLEGGSSGQAVPATLKPLENLKRELAAELIGADFVVSENMLQISWDKPTWDPTWLRTWQMDQRKWRITAWGMEWNLPIDAKPPETFQVWGNVEMTRRTNSWELKSMGTSFDGVFLYPGVRQSLTWDGEKLRLDGFAVGEWAPPKGRRILLRAKASDSFQPQRLWVRIGKP